MDNAPLKYGKLCEEFTKLIENNIDPRKYFHKKKYEAYFKEYCNANANLFESINNECSNLSTDEINSLFRELAAAISGYAKKDTDALKGIKKENRKGELNLFMVTSVFPCILKSAGEYGEQLCDCIADAWKQDFDGIEIGYTTYEKLCDSFRGFFSFLTGR